MYQSMNLPKQTIETAADTSNKKKNAKEQQLLKSLMKEIDIYSKDKNNQTEIYDRLRVRPWGAAILESHSHNFCHLESTPLQLCIPHTRAGHSWASPSPWLHLSTVQGMLLIIPRPSRAAEKSPKKKIFFLAKKKNCGWFLISLCNNCFVHARAAHRLLEHKHSQEKVQSYLLSEDSSITLPQISRVDKTILGS